MEKNWIGNKRWLLDGAMGTMLQAKGLPPGKLPDLYNIEHPDVMVEIHRAYLAAGADIITANTFQSSSLKVGEAYTVEEVIAAGIQNARTAGAKIVALDVGPLGQLLEPMGPMSFEWAYKLFREQMIAGAQAGADLILLETFTDLLEIKAALLAAKESTDLPVLCSMSYQADGRTFMGTDPVTATLTLQSLGADAVGVNCSLGPLELQGIVDQILTYAKVPVLVQANAGLPHLVEGETVYTIDPQLYAAECRKMAEKGVGILGGCCGTTPEFIALLRQVIDGIEDMPVIRPKIVTAACSGTGTVFFNGTTVIGERINPTGKKRMKQALREGALHVLVGEAIDQAPFSDILDVNVGLPEIDEPAVMARAVKEIQGACPLPLQIDSSDPAAIESGCRAYNGRPMINSVNGKAESMAAIFPIAKKYGALVVCLTLDEEGIPDSAEKRLAIARRIMEEAAAYGIAKEDLLVDTLTLTASAQQEQVMETIRAISMVKSQLGLKTVLGVSNVSFGLPQREVVNATFLAAAFGAGLDAAILNPLSKRYMEVVDAFRALTAQDADCAAFIEKYGNMPKEQSTPTPAGDRDLREIILQGRKEEAAAATAALLQCREPMDIISHFFIPALNEVGARYEKGQSFLPQLIQSAETVTRAFEVLRARMGQSEENRGAILLATVKGDVHDIGKNIVRMLLENYGYHIIDLGKDVPIAEVVSAARAHGVGLVGLSALMTTTVKHMQETIKALKDAGIDCPVVVGGAVLTEDYAKMVGADYYAPDAMAGVHVAQSVFDTAKGNTPS